MPSASTFVSNLSLNSTNNKPPATFNICEEFTDSKYYDSGSSRQRARGATKMLVMTSAAVVVSSSIPTGYNIGVLNAPQNILKTFCNESVYNTHGYVMDSSELNVAWSIIVAAFLVGAIVGSASAGWLGDKFGRKRTLMVVNLLGIISAVMFTVTKVSASAELMLTARIIVGYFAGYSMIGSPLYLTEISPKNLRGLMGVLPNAGLGFGLFVSQILGIRFVLGTESGWPYLLGFYGMLVLAGTLVLFLCPESPHYLFVIKGKTETAIRELCRVRSCSAEFLEDEISLMKVEYKARSTSEKWSIARLIKSSALRPAVLMLFALHCGNQLSGINAVFYYSNDIFTSAGMGVDESQFASIGAGLVNFIMASLALLLVSRFGRRPLLLVSVGLTVFTLVGLTVSLHYMMTVPWLSYIAIAFLILFVITFGVALGPVPFFIGTEMLPAGPRPTVMSLGCALNGVSNFFVGLMFPSMQAAIGEFSFILFIISLCLLFGAVFKWLPETKDSDPEVKYRMNVTLKENVINYDDRDLMSTAAA